MSIDLHFYPSVTKTVSNIRTANSILESLESISEKNNDKMKMWNETISSQLKALKDKIAQAKHIAEGVRNGISPIMII